MGLDLSKFKSTKDCGADKQSKKAVLYGPPGCGALELAATLVDEGVIIVSSERGNLALSDCDILTAEVSSLDEASMITRDVVNNDKCENFKHIVVDSFSDLLSRDVASRKGNNMKIYGEMYSAFQKFMLLFETDHSPNLWAICHQEDEKKRTGPDGYSLTGRVQPSLPGEASWIKIKNGFDFHFRVINANGEKRLQCKESEKAWAYDRSGKLDKLEPADLMHILKKVRGGK